MRKLFLGSLLVLVLGAAGIADAQCTVANVITTPYGAGCNTVFGVVPALSGAWNQTTCILTLTLTSAPGCCNTFITSRYLVFGLNQVSVPVPSIGPGCNLLASPDLVLTYPSSAGNTFSFALPPGFPPIQLYGQGAVQYFTTIGFSTNYEVTNGLSILVL